MSDQLTTGKAGGMRKARRRGRVEIVPVYVPVPDSHVPFEDEDDW